jgi:amino-acid N-acetyltransferase
MAALLALPLAVWERDGLKAALGGVGLPTEDVATAGPLFWRFSINDDVPVGFGGLEVHGSDALLRSVVTLPPLRGRGLGRKIVMALEGEAVVAQCSAVWLLTTTAQDFFAKLGYAAVDRGTVPAAIRATAQFALLCPDTAAVMAKRLA